jgi:tRNA modification GTPase
MHLDNALLHLTEAIEAARTNGFLDMVSIDLTHAAEELGKITGESAGEDIIENIFRNFCVGK